MKFAFAYKCRICGEVSHIGQVESTTEAITEQLNKTLKIEEFMGMGSNFGSKKMIALHRCRNGSIGYADFLGAVKTDP